MSYKLAIYILLLYFVFVNFNFGEINLEKQPKTNYTIPYEAMSWTEKLIKFSSILSPSYPILSQAIFIYFGFYLWDKHRKKKIIEKIESSRYRRRY